MVHDPPPEGVGVPGPELSPEFCFPPAKAPGALLSVEVDGGGAGAACVSGSAAPAFGAAA
jgi:hypothetical protein